MQSSGMSKVNMRVDGVNLKEVYSYVYLDKEMNVRYSLHSEIARDPGWGKFCSNIYVLKASDLVACMHFFNIFNTTVLKAATSGSGH